MTSETKKHIDSARQVLVGVVPNPTSQIDQITNALIYKFMDDMDQSAIKAGGKPSFFVGDLKDYAWTRLMDTRIGNQERMNLYSEALLKFSEAKQLPDLFRGIFKSAFLPYRSPETLGLFLKEIDYFDYSHPEELGNAYEYLLSIMSSQGDAGQFRTPRHIIDFIVDVVNPTKDDRVLDPACGTGGFLVSSYKHILEQHDGKNDQEKKEKALTPDDRKNLANNFEGYDIDPGMVRIAQVNMYLHQFKNPRIYQYDTLSNDDRWNDKFSVILANPPFMSPKGGIRPHSKFSIQSSRSEVLFVDYIMSHLRPKGRAGIIVPEGIIFQSGTAHRQLREKLVKDGLYAVVSLPSGVFQPYSGVKTSILFFDEQLVTKRDEILFVDIIDTGVSLGATQRAIEQNDLISALTTIKYFQDGKVLEPSKLAFITAKQEIINNSYDLSLAKYKKRIATDNRKPFVLLSDVCNIAKGKSSSTKTETGPYPLFLTAEENKTADHFDFEGKGVAVPLISATGHGKAAIKRIHFVIGKFALANLLAFIEPKNTQKLSPKYLYYILDSAKDEMAKLMKGAANVSMKMSDLEAFQIPLPPIETQEQIATELDGYAGIISGAKQISENWKLKIDVDSKWEKVKLGEVFKIESGGTPSSTEKKYWDGDIKWATLIDIPSTIETITDTKRKITPEGLKNSSAKLFPKGTVMISSRATIGRIAIAGVEMSTNQGFKNVIIDSKNEPIYVAYALSEKVEEMKSLASGGTFKEISKTHFSNLEISLPPLAIQKQIVEKIETERTLVESSKKLIEIYEQKTKETIAKLWND